MPPDPWAEFEEVSPAQAPSSAPRSAPKPIIAVPDYRSRDDARADEQLRIAQESAARAAQNETQADERSNISGAASLRQEFFGQPIVKQFNEVRVATDQIVGLASGKSSAMSDLGLIFSYMKALDPGSVVREGEFATAQNAAGVPDRIRNLYNKAASGERLNDDQRKDMARTAQAIYSTRLASYNDLANIYRGMMQKQGYDPDANGVLLYDPPKLDGEQGVRDPEMRGGLPVGTAIQFGMDGPETPFDRGRYLQEQYGITPDQEARVLAFWNQNRGNEALTPETAKQWYAAAGIPMPSDQDLASMAENVRKGLQVLPMDTSGAEQAYRDRLSGQLEQEGFDPNSLNSYGARAVQGAFMGLTDELQGIGGGIEALFSNEGVADGYRFNRDKAREAYSQMEEAQGGLGVAAELAGGLVGGGIGASRAPITAARAAREGAAMGSVAGFGYGEGAQDSLIGAAGGAAVGGGLGYGIGRGVEALAARGAARAGQPMTPGGEVIQAADNLNSQFGTSIAPMPADVAGPATRRLTGASAQLPLSAAPIVKAAENVSDEAKRARDAIAAMTGTATTNEAAGDAALRGAQTYMKRSKTKVDALYNQARRIGGDEPVDLAEARAVLDQNIAELSQTPGGAPGLSELQALRAELDAPYPVEGVKRMRTTLRDRFMKDGLRNSDLERRVGQVVDAADTDIANSLSAAGKPDAVRAYQEAAAAHKERIGVIDEVLAPFIGKSADKSVEDVMKAIDTATKTKGARLGKFLSALPPEDAGTVRATIISKLGRASPGVQDAAGDVFSLPQFLTHWNQMSGKAKSEMFGGEVRAALDNLAKVADGSKEAQRYANFSNTGSAVGLVASGGVAAELFNRPIRTALFFVPQYVAGKLLASPSFARWLAKMPAQPGAQGKHVSALTRIAANDNAIATEALGLKEALEAVLAPPGRAVAAPAPSSETPQGPETGAPR
ncbi:hypothetical protein [Novosphingobium sp. M1R2S20]|uniref:DdrB-like domain-containing protein n=1 Tax=Novosphingobium rhizovicinum TaxID=3228928 RepID=A0ABV3RCU7_9SPHN